MPSKGLHLGVILACVAVMAGGCMGGPSGASSAQNKDNTQNYEYDGHLFKSLTGRKTDSSAANQQPAGTPGTPAPSGVQQASATMAADPGMPQATAAVGSEQAPGTVGPLVAGPSTSWQQKRSGSVLTGQDPVLLADGSAGPPPSVPNELPPPPDGGVSINEARNNAKEKKTGFELSDLAPEKAWNNLKAAAGYGPDEKIAREAKKEGEALYREKKYKEAMEKFGIAADRWPDTSLEEDALYMQGESAFFADLYPKAHDVFGGLLKKYPNTRYLDTVMIREFAIGRFWEQLYDAHPSWPVTPNLTDKNKPMFDTFGYAVQAYERIRHYDPLGPLADDSLMALGNAYFRREQYADAAEQYDLLRKEYPNSPYQLNAHLLGLQAKMRVYQGTPYDGTPLRDGEKIAKQTLTQFGSKLGENRDRVLRAHAQIVEEQANREFLQAQYYEQHKYYGAARYYYKYIIDKYPTTDKAKEAKDRMEKIQNEPDEPPDHLKWLKDVLGSNKR
jgi:outer membrane protein assembly factor BamD (BamD/ComL family)